MDSELLKPRWGILLSFATSGDSGLDRAEILRVLALVSLARTTLEELADRLLAKETVLLGLSSKAQARKCLASFPRSDQLWGELVDLHQLAEDAREIDEP